MITICKEFKFDAAHYLPDYVGKCNNLHGHTFRLQVEIGGEIQETGSQQGMIMDFSVLKGIVDKKIIENFDHKCLNDIKYNPTAENLIVDIVEILRNSLTLDMTLVQVKLYETDTSFVRWRNESL